MPGTHGSSPEGMLRPGMKRTQGNEQNSISALPLWEHASPLLMRYRFVLERKGER
jgi:hypothetical protein